MLLDAVEQSVGTSPFELHTRVAVVVAAVVVADIAVEQPASVPTVAVASAPVLPGLALINSQTKIVPQLQPTSQVG